MKKSFSTFLRMNAFVCLFPVVLLILVCLTGCAAVGPDYARPETRTPSSWRTDPTDGLRNAPEDPDTLARWWTALKDPVLSGMMTRAVTGNLDLKEAKARVREARARRAKTRSGLYPGVDATASASHSGAGDSGKVTELYQTGFDASWELDIFGGIRRAVEAADADYEASRENQADVLVSLAAETALNYLEIRTYQMRLFVAEANLVAQEETLSLTRSRFEAGLSDELAVQQALYTLESTRSQIPTLRTGLEEAKNRLAVLIGEPPGFVHEELRDRRPIPVPPVSVAVGVPADILRRRPDIRNAERLLAAQTARIGVAESDFWPKFRLSGSIGLSSLSASDLITSGSSVWKIGPSLTWNVFDAGAVRRNIEIQSALQEQALVRYESAVLTALEEVENAMTAYAEEQIRRESLVSAAAAAQRATDLARDKYRAGLVDFESVLDAQRSLLSFQDQLAASEGTVTANFVRLYKSLGGGWTPDPEGFNAEK